MPFNHRHADMELHTHTTVAEARECEADAANWAFESAAAAEDGFERWLEDAGSRLDPAGYAHDAWMEALDPGLVGAF